MAPPSQELEPPINPGRFSPSKEFCADQFEGRFVEMVNQSPSLSGKFERDKKRGKKTLKIINGQRVRLGHAGSSTALKSDPFCLAIIDEYDSYAENVNGQGDPLGLIRARGFSYSDFTIACSSTPTIGSSDVTPGKLQFWQKQDPKDIDSKIWKMFQQGTRYHWAVPCPMCRDYFIPRFSCLRWPDGATADEARQSAHLECPNCGGVIENASKRALNALGRYVAPCQTIEKDGTISGPEPTESIQSWWVSGICSPFTSYGQLAGDYLAAVELSDPSRIQTALNSGFGELFRLGWGADAPKWSDVAEHRSVYAKGEAPDGIVYVIVTVDVQARSLFYVARGWGARSTSWLLDWGQLYGETVHDEVWNALADYITNTICGFPVRLVLVDSGFRPGKKDEIPQNKVYDFVRRFRGGKVLATKGSSHVMTKPLHISKQEVTPKGKALKYGIDLLMLDPGYWKNWVHERLHWEKNQLGDWHLPVDVSDEYMKQIISESRTRLPSGKVIWVEHTPKNHYLDAEALQAAGAHLLNVARIPPTADLMQRRPPFADKEKPMNTSPPPAPVKQPDDMSDEECLKQVETLIASNPQMLNDADVQKMLRELKEAGGVVNLPAPPALPPNVNPATTLPGVKWKD